MQSVLDKIHKWTKKWRMVINCQKNKTEIICFNSPEGKPPRSFKLGEDEIHTVTSSKVLGVILDKDMKEHSKSVHKNLLYKWISMDIKAIFFSSLFYAGMLWMKDKNMREIEKL